MRGLTSEEVSQRKAEGLANDAVSKAGTTYLDIAARNILTPYNVILFILGVALLLCDELISALSATGIIVVNILISTIQEMRAKRRLDRIAILAKPKVSVIRDGEETEIQDTEVVRDDVVVLRAGDQAVVDGEVLECRFLEMDESLLTGESSTVRKEPGDTIYSGSNCVTGEVYYRVTAFGSASYAANMLSSARRMSSKRTPLQMETSTVTELLMAIAAVLFVLTVFKSLLFTHESLSGLLEVFVLCLDVVPIALFLLITLTYMIAALRMADSGVLLQRSSSVESISHVDTVCMDKTGTITTNRLKFEESRDYVGSAEADRLAAVFAGATGSRNSTAEAIAARYGEAESTLVEEVQFSSARKFSAVRVEDVNERYTLVLGAWDVLSPHVADPRDAADVVAAESRRGLRTVALCRGKDEALTDADGEPVLGDLELVSIMAISDEIRPDCRETIQVFLDNGMDLKIISGDDPVTVDSLFTLAGIPGERKTVSGPEIDAMDDEELAEAAAGCNIFGRMRPEHKERVVSALMGRGRYVAMIGDGVNDVKSLKAAQVGVALESGAGAARGVADMILLKDDFSALPKSIVEGRRTVTGMRDILKLYLTRNFSLAIMFVVVYLLFGSIPMIPIQNTFYAFLSVAIMAFFMTLFAKPSENKELILPDVLRYCLPAAVMVGLFGVIVYGATWWAVDSGALAIDYDAVASYIGYAGTGEDLFELLSWEGSGPAEVAARSAMTLFVTLFGLFQIFIICPRWKRFSLDGKVNRSPVPLVITVLIILLLLVAYAFFPSIIVELVGLTLFPWECYAATVVLIVVLLAVEFGVLKMNLFRRFVDWFERYYMRKLDDAYGRGKDTEKEPFWRRSQRVAPHAAQRQEQVGCHPGVRQGAVVLHPLYPGRVALHCARVRVVQLRVAVPAAVVLARLPADLRRRLHYVGALDESPAHGPRLLVQELAHVVSRVVGGDPLPAEQFADLPDHLLLRRGLGDHLQRHVCVLEDPRVAEVVVPPGHVVPDHRRVGVLHPPVGERHPAHPDVDDNVPRRPEQACGLRVQHVYLGRPVLPDGAEPPAPPLVRHEPVHAPPSSEE